MKEHRIQNTEYRTQTGDYEKQRNCLSFGLWAPSSEEGMVLVVSLLLLLVATVVGITALSTSTTNVMITGNQRLNEVNFRAADSGINLSVPIIVSAHFGSTISATYTSDPDLTFGSGLYDEIHGTQPADCPVSSPTCSTPAPDIQFTLGSGAAATTASIDIDYLYSAAASGASILMFMGYEGTGTGAGSGGILIYYPIDSYAEGPAGSQTRVYGVYQYVTQ